MRDHTKLKAFQLADRLALQVYEATAIFPKSEQFVLTSQMRRAGVSIVSNILEGCARQTESDYICFLDIAYASSRELQYQLSLALRLGFLDAENYNMLEPICIETSKVLNGLLRALRGKAAK